MILRTLRLAAALLAAGAGLPVAADTLVDQVVAASGRADAGQGFVRIMNHDGGEEASGRRVERYDPALPTDERWQLISVDGAVPSAKDLKAYAEKLRHRQPPPTYGRIAGYLDAGATLVADTATEAVYRLDRLPAGALRLRGSDISQHLVAEAVIDKRGPLPFMRRLRLYTEQPFSFRAIARVTEVEAVYEYQAAPDGQVRIEGQSLKVRGKAPFRSFAYASASTFADFTTLDTLTPAAGAAR